MDYRTLASVQATITSYLDAFNKMQEYCKDVEPSCNEFNSRTVLPTNWGLVGGYDSQKLRRDANYLYITHAELFDFGKPKYLAKGYWDYDSFFKVSWQLRIPFNIYAWEYAKTEYPDGFDDAGNPIGEAKHIPAVMVEWCSPQYLKLGEISSWGMKVWSLPKWKLNHAEIESFMDDNPNLKEQYRKAILKTDIEVEKWIEAWTTNNNLASSIFAGADKKKMKV